jgi:hypothetical protein
MGAARTSILCWLLISKEPAVLVMEEISVIFIFIITKVNATDTTMVTIIAAK